LFIFDWLFFIVFVTVVVIFRKYGIDALTLYATFITIKENLMNNMIKLTSNTAGMNYEEPAYSK